MTRISNIVLSLAAGLVGGIVSRGVLPTPVHAQTSTAAPKEIRAQRFTLVDESGKILGTFGFDPTATERERSSIRLFDIHGKEVWSAGGPQIRSLSER